MEYRVVFSDGGIATGSFDNITYEIAEGFLKFTCTGNKVYAYKFAQVREFYLI